jgi:hypothetical protein
MESNDRYEKEISENRYYFDADLQSHRDSMFEYGITSLKNLMLFNGGGLIALPAFEQLTPNTYNSSIKVTAGLFVVGLVLSIVSSYMAHLNFSALYVHTDLQKHRRSQKIEEFYLKEIFSSNPSPEVTDEKIESLDLKIRVTFWLAHIAGILSLISFSTGAYLFATSEVIR